jgi:glutathione synthase/RimK-type ligase-like ATP-grasp enzyme
METVGVLCARARVEEKSLMAALAAAGIVSAIFPPVDEPLPVGPLPISPNGNPFPVPRIVIDRHQDRQIARAVLASCRALGVPALSAGIAATGDRLDVASALAAHGLPRPHSALCTSEDAALKAVRFSGLPATLMPLDMKSDGIALLDQDTAEAVLEHRAVLGGSDRSLGLIQAGAPIAHQRAEIIVVDGRATALQPGGDLPCGPTERRLAEEAARALRADLVAITIARIGSEPIVWDVHPAPDFRDSMPIAVLTVAEAIAHAVAQRLRTMDAASMAQDLGSWIAITPEGVHDDIVIRA